MHECFQRADAARAGGDRGEAHRLSDEGKAHQARMKDLNRQASDFIFRENTATDRVADDTIDLHGQFVEAENILEQRITQARAQGQTHLHVIVGKGNHSAGHVQHIKPRVERICRDLGLQCATEQNEGRLCIDLTGGQVDAAPPPLPQQPGGQQAGHGYQSPPPQGTGYTGGYNNQQSGSQQQQQQADPVDRLLGNLCKKMANCCTVM